MPSNNAIGIIGSDGHAPMYQPDGRWAIWSIHDIYMGQQGSGKYIPKVNDHVTEPETGARYIVTDISSITFVPELAPLPYVYQPVTIDNLISEVNTADVFRCYFDKSMSPYTLTVDGLLKINSSSATYARIYQGQFINPNKILSRRYDNNGNFIGHDIPLTLVAFNNHDNYAVKSIPQCSTTEQELQDGELVTVVVYDSDARVLSKRHLLIENTTYVPLSHDEQRYITNISIKSPFITLSNDSEINYPVNLPLTSFNPIGVVHYNDGSTIEYPVNGDKFRLLGLDQFVAGIVGHRVPLVLSYRLDQNESVLWGVSANGNFVTRPITLLVSNPNTSYNVKLYIYPKWIDEVNGYTYEAYLVNLDRNTVFNVTNKVSLAYNSPIFMPTAYGVAQRLIFNLNLRDASTIYNHFQYTQTVDIFLRAPANDSTNTNIWEVGTQIPTNVGYYGTNLRAIRNNLNTKHVTIDNQSATISEFLAKLYYKTEPLLNRLTETVPIVPTHMEVTYGNESIIKPIEDFNTTFMFNTTIQQFSNVRIVFLKQHSAGYFTLSVSALTVR